jgi:NADH-quinone oxidoreductase subunit G
LGCNTTPVARYRELLKTVARRNEVVNDWFICDRGRFSNSEVNDPQRPRRALVDSRETGVDDALEALLLRIREIGELYGPGSIAVVGSSRMAQEAAELLPQLAHRIGAGALCFCTTRKEQAETRALLELLLAGRSASQQDVRNSDCIVICGCDLLNEAPMMALAVRQAWRNGATVYVTEQRISLPCEFTLCASLDDVPLAEAERPVIICNVSARVDLLDKLQEKHSHLKLAGLFPAANSFGTARVTRESGAISLEEALADGEIKGIISIEADIPSELLDGVSFVAALDWQTTAAVQAAKIVIPTSAWVEMDGSYINYEGRTQHFSKVMSPGIPIRGLDPAGHPPHTHRSIAPGGEALPALQLLATLIKLHDGDNKGRP